MQLRTAHWTAASVTTATTFEKSPNKGRLAVTHLVQQKDAGIVEGHPQLTGISLSAAQPGWKSHSLSLNCLGPNIITTEETARLLLTASLGRGAPASLALQNLQLAGPRCDPWLSTQPCARTHGWIDYGFPSMNYARPALFPQPQPPRISAPFSCWVSIFEFE